MKYNVNDAQISELFSTGRTGVSVRGYNSYKMLAFKVGSELIIEGLEFETYSDEFTISITNNSYPLVIKDCIFKKKTVFAHGNMAPLSFDNVQFEGGLSIEINLKDLNIKNCIEPFRFYLKSEVESNVEIVNCKFTDLIIDRSFIKGDVSLQNVTALSTVKLSQHFINNTRLVNLICKELQLEISNKEEIFKTQASIFMENVDIEKFLVSHRLYAALSIYHSRFREIEFQNNLKSEKIIFMICTVESELKLDFDTFSSKVRIEIGGCQFHDRLHLRGTLNTDTDFKINNSTISKLYFIDFKNFGSFTLKRIMDVQTLTLFHSNLGKAGIHSCNFKRGAFEFDKSQINEIFISETDFPEEVTVMGKPNQQQEKLAFGQLQTVFQKQGDSTRAYEYLAREVAASYKIMGWEDFQNKLSLFLNKWSNNFGRNWLVGVGFTFFVGFAFFYAVVISTDQYVFGLPITPEGLTGPFLKFMNPLRHFDPEALFSYLKQPLTFSNWSYVWDFLGRLFVAYGYYQTIQAFRKFGRK